MTDYTADGYAMRALSDDELPALASLAQLAFLSGDSADVVAGKVGIQLGAAERLGVFDGDRLVGSASTMVRELTLPEELVVPFLAVTWVVVAPDHRRRGVLSGLMRTQLERAHERGGPAIAALWASEAAIYQRFGYGMATERINYEVLAKAPFRPEVDLGVERVRELPPEEAVVLARPVYDAYAARRAGALGRSDRNWEYRLHDPVALRRGKSALRWAVLPDGYAVFRTQVRWGERGADCLVEVDELVATTPTAHAALLRYVMDTDLAGSVTVSGGLDDPLPVLLGDSRTAVARVDDALYVRLVDVDRALAQRRYRSAVDVVIAVSDPLCPWNEGRWRLSVDESGAAVVARTSDPADLSTRSTELGAAYAGGTRLSRLADAGLVQEHTPGAVSALTTALLADRAPRALEVF